MRGEDPEFPPELAEKLHQIIAKMKPGKAGASAPLSSPSPALAPPKAPGPEGRGPAAHYMGQSFGIEGCPGPTGRAASKSSLGLTKPLPGK